MQYQLSAVFRPFDVLANELLQILPQDQLAHFFIILRDTRTLLMHANGSINQARNHLALRAINHSFSVTNNNSTYTMATDTFQTTVSQQASAQRALRDACPHFRRPLTNNSATNQTNISSATTPNNNSHFFFDKGAVQEEQFGPKTTDPTITVAAAITTPISTNDVSATNQTTTSATTSTATIANSRWSSQSFQRRLGSLVSRPLASLHYQAWFQNSLRPTTATLITTMPAFSYKSPTASITSTRNRSTHSKTRTRTSI